MVQVKIPRPHPSLGFVSTYPPTKCGLATFTHSLAAAIANSRQERSSLGVVRVSVDPRGPDVAAPGVLMHLDPASSRSVRQVAAELDKFSVAIIQHEFGIFGPNDGASVIALVECIQVPIIVTLHTVPAAPSSGQQQILDRLVKVADAVIVMSEAARATLRRRCGVECGKVHLVPHGAHAYPAVCKERNTRPTILTWGLIGPGKGIEWGIRALPYLRALAPRPSYQIYGETHPNVVRTQGERYRNHLMELAARLGVEDMLEMRNAYLDHDALARLVGSADIVLLPYDSRDQATSGVLIDAVAAGKPVVATTFPHAVELLSDGKGQLVPHEDPQAIARALARLLADPVIYESARRTARREAGSMGWPTVAQRYEELASELTTLQTTEVA